MAGAEKKNALIPGIAWYQGKYGHGSLFHGRERTHEGSVHSQGYVGGAGRMQTFINAPLSGLMFRAG
ncbi:hypothetical protein UW163_12030 [Ralstonia solanacearum]|nr:hypothetical protein UW163_12030 [Ralstonia solanacearum]OAI71813.1 hypothetical protein RSP797_11135 [Ralstonia solanacearum]